MSVASLLAAQMKDLKQSGGGTFNDAVTPTVNVSTVRPWSVRYERSELNNMLGSIPHTVQPALDPTRTHLL